MQRAKILRVLNAFASQLRSFVAKQIVEGLGNGCCNKGEVEGWRISF